MVYDRFDPSLDVITPPMYWDLEEPMGLRPSGVDEQWNPQELG